MPMENDQKETAMKNLRRQLMVMSDSDHLIWMTTFSLIYTILAVWCLVFPKGKRLTWSDADTNKAIKHQWLTYPRDKLVSTGNLQWLTSLQILHTSLTDYGKMLVTNSRCSKQFIKYIVKQQDTIYTAGKSLKYFWSMEHCGSWILKLLFRWQQIISATHEV